MTNDRTPAAAADSEVPAAQQGTWWPREYDAVVERWLALSRAAREGEAR